MSQHASPSPLRRVAVVGSGVAGLTAAHVLAKQCHVTLYEAAPRLGGHADTHEVTVGGQVVNVDTGFIVHNDRTYPTLLRLFDELGVQTQDSDMSMSIRDDDAGLEYAGARGLRGLFPVARNLRNRDYLRMLGEVRRFHAQARKLLAAKPEGAAENLPDHDPAAVETVRDFVGRGGFSDYFQTYFLAPLVAAVWSCDPAVALDYPARYLFTFLDHHGMLTVFGSPTWRTVTSGSARYVERVAAGIQDIRLGHRVTSVTEATDGVHVIGGSGATETFDAVVLAAHPHQSLAMLANPTELQSEVLGAIHYSPNVAQLHTDESVLPRSSAARASWNYWRRPGGDEHASVLVSYDISRLMRLDVTDRRFIVTLGGEDRVDPSTVIDTMHYEHPLYTPESVAAQARLPQIITTRVAFAGAYHGWGFHEDGAKSGLVAAQHLGVDWLDRASSQTRVEGRADIGPELLSKPESQTAPIAVGS
ncbi:FAD-dependent oxidoreductase [Lapillicoccus sp.]|uniref:NAD(P)/FAD-dependent oxidoreductase n=1 Tax=Lapillicoccus sp. TaxID=1909287 RepID=UPI003262D46A